MLVVSLHPLHLTSREEKSAVLSEHPLWRPVVLQAADSRVARWPTISGWSGLFQLQSLECFRVGWGWSIV